VLGSSRIQNGQNQWTREKTFSAVVKVNPKRLFCRSSILVKSRLGKNDLDGAIGLTQPRDSQRFRVLRLRGPLLTSAYLRRAALNTDATKAAADYLSAVRAGEGLNQD